MKLTDKEYFSRSKKLLSVSALLLVTSCTSSMKPVDGPDKQGSGFLTGGLLGGASGLITGAQLGAPTGTGAVIGAAFGAVWGSLSGFGIDLIEEEELRLLAEVDALQEEVWVQNSLIAHLERKKELFPGRDIFPADEFFHADGSNLTTSGDLLARALARRYSSRSSSARVLITSYQISKESKGEAANGATSYSGYIGKRRTQSLANAFVQAGMEPRRFVLRSVALGAPLVDDPYDYEGRYSQAVEFSLLD